MAIHDDLIVKKGRRFVVLPPTKPVGDALHALDEAGAEIVVVQVTGTHRVAFSNDLVKHIRLVGFDAYVQPLSDAPLVDAWRVVPVDVEESGYRLVEDVGNYPSQVLIAIDQEKIAAVFSGTLRAGSRNDPAGVSAFNQLHGLLQNQSDDPRKTFGQHIKPPHCPACNTDHFLKFDTEQGVYICEKTNQVVKQP